MRFPKAAMSRFDRSSIQPTSGVSTAEVHEAIRRRAEEIYQSSGSIPHRDLQNWARAEDEVRLELAARSVRKYAVVVSVEGIRYVGEYDSALADGYNPGEFAAGDPVRVRFNSGKMFVQRPNGRQLETTIVHQVS
jgi:hypothetical protein